MALAHDQLAPRLARLRVLPPHCAMLPALVLIVAKLLGLGVTAFVFDATRDKLLQMAWFHRMYDWFFWAREWAHAQTEPIRQRLQQLSWLLHPQRAGRFFRRVTRLRRRAYRGRPA